MAEAGWTFQMLLTCGPFILGDCKSAQLTVGTCRTHATSKTIGKGNEGIQLVSRSHDVRSWKLPYPSTEMNDVPMASACWRYPEPDTKQTSYPRATSCFAMASMGITCPETGVLHISTTGLRREAMVLTWLS